MTWIVIVYKFDEDIKGWLPETTIEFKDDKSLIEFLKLNSPKRYRYEITKVIQ